jgi:hypothetical protein
LAYFLAENRQKSRKIVNIDTRGEPRADVGVAVLALDDGDVCNVEVGLGLVAVLVGVAQVAVDLAVRTLGAKLERYFHVLFGIPILVLVTCTSN